MLFYLYKAFDKFESGHKSDIFYPKRPVYACTTCYELPFNISIMILRRVLSHCRILSLQL